MALERLDLDQIILIEKTSTIKNSSDQLISVADFSHKKYIPLLFKFIMILQIFL